MVSSVAGDVTQKYPCHSAGHGLGGEVVHKGGEAAEMGGEDPHEGSADIRLRLYDRKKAGLGKQEQDRGLHGLNRGGIGAVIEDRYLVERFPRFGDQEHLFPSFGGDLVDLCAPRLDDVQTFAGVTLMKDDIPPLVAALHDYASYGSQLRPLEVGEIGGPRENI